MLTLSLHLNPSLNLTIPWNLSVNLLVSHLRIEQNVFCNCTQHFFDAST